MAYFIFLKSMRILEEFRKNPHLKISPKSPCTKLQSLCQFKNPIFNSKRISLLFSAQQPSQPTWPFGPPSPDDFLPSPTLKQSRRWPPPAGLTPPPWPPPATSTEGEKVVASPFLHFPNKWHHPLDSSSNRCLQAGTLKLL
jgi:hypothetical protein